MTRAVNSGTCTRSPRNGWVFRCGSWSWGCRSRMAGARTSRRRSASFPRPPPARSRMTTSRLRGMAAITLPLTRHGRHLLTTTLRLIRWKERRMPDSTVNYAFPYPVGGDRVAVHSDVEKLAKAVDAKSRSTEDRVDDAFAEIESVRFDRSATPLTSSDNLDTTGNGIRSVWNGTTATALGLPTETLGTVWTVRYGTGAGMQMWVPRTTTGAQIWLRNELSGGWSEWVRADAGAGQNGRMLRTAPVGGFKTAPLALTLGYGGAQASGSGT